MKYTKIKSIILLYLLSSCMPQVKDKTGSIYDAGEYQLYGNKVTQGEYSANAISREHIISDYKSPARTNYSSLLSFKFAINGKDNEAPSGQDHQLILQPENGSFTTPVIVFGEEDPASYTEGVVKPLPANTEFTVRLDMRAVLQEMDEKGYYTTYQGDQITVDEFEGVYIAGGSLPLSWDFDNLHKNHDYQLQDENADGIYEATFILNPHDPDEQVEREWHLQNDISGYPSYQSEQILIDALYNMALDETEMLIEEDGTFRTGEKWAGVWTRDISYSVILSYAYLAPEVAKTSLMRKVKNGRIIQDTGSGGAWPVSTDRVVWSIAAWEIYKATGDQEWLQKVFPVIKNSLETDMITVYDEQSGLMKGESSFLDWREQTYPDWMDNVDISQSLTLGTNVVFYQSFQVLSQLAEHLGENETAEKYSQEADKLKKAINEKLWNSDRRFYNQYLYGEHFMNVSPRAEALGESLAVLYQVADAYKQKEIISNVPVLNFGTPSIYPQIPNVPPYHNNGIWPFVQAYWNWAAAEAGNQEAVMQGLAALYRPAALFLTNKENFVAENGDFIGTEINSDRQLWSVAGNLAMVYRVLLGLEFQVDGLTFNPFVPEQLPGNKTISGFKYRDAVFNITLQGYGDAIDSIRLGGEPLADGKIPADLEGIHELEIVMNNQFSGDSGINLVENHFSLPAPVVELADNLLNWFAIEGAINYRIYRDGQRVETIESNEFTIPANAHGRYKITALDEHGWESFSSEPYYYLPDTQQKKIEVEQYAPACEWQLRQVSGDGHVYISKEKNTRIEVPLQVDKAGEYLLSFRYANGSGSWNTDNKCAIRTLKVNGQKAGTLVMAQRGTDEWSNWGFTNIVPVQLQKGSNSVTVLWTENNENMNEEVNQAVLDCLLVRRIN